MPIPPIAALERRRQELFSQRTTWESQWQDINDLVAIKGQVLGDAKTPGDKQTQRLFDSTAVHAAQILASSLNGTLTPATQPWLSLVLRQEELNDQQEVKAWLEDAARRLHRALRQSNFNTAVHEMYLDLVGPGTGCLFVEEKEPDATGRFAGFRFREFQSGEYAIAENWEGQVDTVFRVLKLQHRAVLQNPHWTPSADLQRRASTNPDDWVEIVHATFPRRDRDTGKRTLRHAAWASVYYELKSKHRLEESGFPEFPYCCPRWLKQSGEVYGRSPSHTALPDVASLNVFKEWILKALPLAVQPPTLERDGALVERPNLTPNGRNVAEGSQGLDDLLRFLNTNFRPDIANFGVNDLRASVREMYYNQQLQLPDKAQMTATEAAIQYELMQRLLGPTVGRLEAEFLNPLVTRCFALMARGRAFMDEPDILAELGDQADLDIEYEGPLARAQRTIEITAQDRFVAFLFQIAAAGKPEVLDLANWDQMARDRAQVLGVPANQLLGQQQVDAVRTTRQQQQAQAAQLETGLKLAEAGGKVAPLLAVGQSGAQAARGQAA